MERDQAEEPGMARRSCPRGDAPSFIAASVRRGNRRRHCRTFGQPGDAFSLAEAISGEERAAAFLNRKSGRRAGVVAFTANLKAIVDDNITNFYATPEKPTLTRLWKRILADCRASGMAPPSIRRLKAYLATLDAEAIVRRERERRGEARFLGLPGSFAAERAMQIVQIDHTKVDVTVVDPVERLPIGRPILTIGVDVFTRMVVGFYLSLEAPSVTLGGRYA